MRGIELGIIIGQLNTGNDQVVLLIGGVGAKDQPVDTVIFPLRPAKHNKSFLNSIADATKNKTLK